MDAWPLAYACDNQMINLNVTEPSLKMGPLGACPLFGELSAKRLSKSRAKGRAAARLERRFRNLGISQLIRRTVS
jgi:hypothetical protein